MPTTTVIENCITRNTDFFLIYSLHRRFQCVWSACVCLVPVLCMSHRRLPFKHSEFQRRHSDDREKKDEKCVYKYSRCVSISFWFYQILSLYLGMCHVCVNLCAFSWTNKVMAGQRSQENDSSKCDSVTIWMYTNKAHRHTHLFHVFTFERIYRHVLRNK